MLMEEGADPGQDLVGGVRRGGHIGRSVARAAPSPDWSEDRQYL
jgi:hypothetical protein